MVILGTELEDFINPPKIAWYDAEIKHLMNNADRNRDFVLSKVFQNLIHLIFSILTFKSGKFTFSQKNYESQLKHLVGNP